MTTKTTITLSPIKRCYTSPHLKRRRMTSISTNRKHLPDLLHDIFIEQQRRETISNIATILRKVGDQMDEQLQTNNTLSSNQIFGQRTIRFVNCLSHVLWFFL